MLLLFVGSLAQLAVSMCCGLRLYDYSWFHIFISKAEVMQLMQGDIAIANPRFPFWTLWDWLFFRLMLHFAVIMTVRAVEFKTALKEMS